MAVRFLMALTGNTEINKYAINKFGNQFGENGSFRLVSKSEMKDSKNPREGLFSATDDYNSLTNLIERHPQLHEVAIDSAEKYAELTKKLQEDKDRIPIFIKDHNDELIIVPSYLNEAQELTKKSKLVYLGKELEK